MRLSEKRSLLPKQSDSAISVEVQSAPSFERHYSTAEVAQMWGLSEDSVRRLFRSEPGVLSISPRQRRGKRSYATLRIPASIVARVHKRCSVVSC